jgi:hypothetical protein
MELPAVTQPKGIPINESALRDVEAAAIGQQVLVFEAATGRTIDAAFENLAREKAEALFVTPGAFFLARRVQLAVLAARYAIPATYSIRTFVEAGGLMSYGTNFADMSRQVGLYAANLLKGAKPMDLPVMQATRFELVINLNTARALRLDVPPTLLATADEVSNETARGHRAARRRGDVAERGARALRADAGGRYETSPPQAISAPGSGRCRVPDGVAYRAGASLSDAARACSRWLGSGWWD